MCSFANAPEAARMDWSSFTKGYFLNRESLVSVLLLVDASVPPQKIDLDCANWLGRNNVWFLVETTCSKLTHSISYWLFINFSFLNFGHQF